MADEGAPAPIAESESAGTPPAGPGTAASGTPPASGAPKGPPSQQNIWELTDEYIDGRGGGFAGAREGVKQLLFDNQKLRAKNRQLRERVVDDGAEVLRGDQLAQWKKYAALGLNPEQIQEKLNQHAVLTAKVKSAEQDTFINDVADAAGIPNKKAFVKLAQKFGIELQVRDVKEKDDMGKDVTVKRAFARLANEPTAEFRQLDTYIEEELKEFQSALYADGDAPGNGGPQGRPHAPERKVTPMPNQSAGSRSASGGNSDRAAVQGVLDSRYKRDTAPAKR